MGFCSGLAKFMSGIALVLTVIIGIALVAVGAWGLATAGNVAQLQASEPAAFGFYIACIVIGGVLLLASIAGFCGLCADKPACTNLFASLLCACAVLLLALAIWATVLYVQFQNNPEQVAAQIWSYLPQSAKDSFGAQYGCNAAVPLVLNTPGSCLSQVVSVLKQWFVPGLAIAWAAFGVVAIVAALLCAANRRSKKAKAAEVPAVPELKQQVVVQPATPVVYQTQPAAPGAVYQTQPGTVYATQPGQPGTVYATQPGTVYAAPPQGTVYAAPGTVVQG